MNIGSFGFPADQVAKLEKILSLSRNNRYEIIEFNLNNLPDLLLVFEEELLSDASIKDLHRAYHSRIIVVSREKPETDHYAHIGYPLVSSRVLRTLDQLTNENEEFSPEDLATSDGNKDLFKKYEKQIEEVQAQSAAEAEHSHSFRVLVVDDSKPMQEALAKELSLLPDPVNVDFADDGESALELVEQNTYDFIFLDIIMPGIDGFETCTRMRERPDLKKTPIIMLSSKTSPLDEVKGIMAGCSTYLTKPINTEEFQKVIARVSSWISEFKPS